MNTLKLVASKIENSFSEKNLDNRAQKKLCQTSLEEVTDFYNSNEELFKTFQNEFNINIWFLNHFRTYMSYRNDALGIHNTPTKRIKKHKILFRICKEILFILLKYAPLKNRQSEHLTILNYSDQIEGKNKRFNKLGLTCDSLDNRPLFDIKNSISFSHLSSNNTASSDHILLHYLFKLTFFSDLFRFHKQLKELKQQISSQDLNNKESKINTIFWKNTVIYYIYYLRFKSFDNYLKKSKYKIILISDENSPQQKVIQYAAKLNGVKVFAFQHGNIHELHPAYIYGNYNSKPILSNIIFCWGEFFTELLVNKGGYSASQVKNVGRVTFENSTIGLNHELKGLDNILLYASQPQRDKSLRKRLLKDILLSCKKLKSSYTLVIRPHPNEKEDTFFKQVAEEVGYFNFIIDRQSDLQSHFKACKIFIVAFSTVGTEFIPHYKPMLVLDYYEQDLVGFIKNGVGIPIRKQVDLLAQLSKSKLEINKDKYKAFIAKYYDTGEHVIEKIKKYLYES